MIFRWLELRAVFHGLREIPPRVNHERAARVICDARNPDQTIEYRSSHRKAIECSFYSMNTPLSTLGGLWLIQIPRQVADVRPDGAKVARSGDWPHDAIRVWRHSNLLILHSNPPQRSIRSKFWVAAKRQLLTYFQCFFMKTNVSSI